MRVLVISGAFPPMPAGEATNTLYLCEHLVDRGLDVHVLTTRTSANGCDARIKVYPLMDQWSWLEAARLIKVVKHCSPDAILLMYISWIYNFHPMTTFLPTICRRLVPDIRFVTRFENAFCPPDPTRMFFPSRAVRWGLKQWASAKSVDYNFGTLLRDSDCIIALSEVHRVFLSERCPTVREKSILIPPPPNMRLCHAPDGVARERGRDVLGVKSDEFLIAFLGYIYPSKGPDSLLHAFGLLNRELSNVKLVFIGGSLDPKSGTPTSYAQEMVSLSERLGVADKVTWTGEYQWDSEEVSLYLHAADACVLPFEGGVQLNNSSLACAVTHGLPVVTTRGRMLDEPLVHKQNVFLCPTNDPAALAAAIKLLIDNPELRNRLRVGARLLAEEWFSWNRAVERTVEALTVDGR